MARKSFSNEFTYKRFLDEGNEAEFDRLFDEAADRARKAFGTTYHMYIGGRAVDSDSLLVEKSPIDGRAIGNFQKGRREHAKAAVEAAHNAFRPWSDTDYEERAGIFERFADVLSKNKFDLAAILSLENGKSRYESIGEVDEAIDFSRYYANEIVINRGYSRRTKLEESRSKVSNGFQGAPSKAEKVRIALRPYGVFGVIAPFNFPVSISTGMSVGAMITGNAVVFKPSSTDNMTMLTGLRIYEMLKQSGLPDGVFNFVTGPGSEVGDELAANPDVSGIAFTGSKAVGLGMLARTYSNGGQKVFVVEMGGKNPAIVGKTANIEDAVSGITSAAFGFAGQKCSALSRVYVHESIKEKLIGSLVERMRNLKVGDPLKKDVYIGPLISESAYRRYTETVERIRSSGRLLYGGNRVNTNMNGFYVEPVLAELRQDNELVHRELFLPVLSIIPFREFGDALKMANDVEYGLTAGLYSRNRSEIREFSRLMDSGVIYINRAVSATTGAIVGLHTFVGWKGSGLTGKGTGSKFYLQQFMREQSLSITK